MAKTIRGSDWLEFAEIVFEHIENYTVRQYGDRGGDQCTSYQYEDFMKQIKKYDNRSGKNARPGQDKLDLLKIAHYAQMAYDSLCGVQEPRDACGTEYATGDTAVEIPEEPVKKKDGDPVLSFKLQGLSKKRKGSKPQWYNDGTPFCGFYYALCSQGRQFKRILKDLDSEEYHGGGFINGGCDGTTHFIGTLEGTRGVVCVTNCDNLLEMVGLLVHEGQHIWQVYKEAIGEEQAGIENEAYSVQSIVVRLLGDWLEFHLPTMEENE